MGGAKKKTAGSGAAKKEAEQAPPETTKKQAPPPAAAKKMGTGSKAQNWLTAVAVAVAAYIVFRGGGGSPLTYLDATDAVALKKVFFSGEVWAVACASPEGGAPDAFEAVGARLKEEMQFGVLDCRAKLPSGRSTLQRWKLDAREEPVIFVTNGAQVNQIPSSSARSQYDMVRELRLAAIRRPAAVTSSDAFKQKCRDKPRCLLVLQGSELEQQASKALDHLMAVYGSDPDVPVAFASVDAHSWKLDFEGFEIGDKVRLRRFDGGHRAVYFRNSSNAFSALAHKGGLLRDPLSAFLETVLSDETKLVKLSKPPSLQKRQRPKRKPAEPKTDAEQAAADRRQRRADFKADHLKNKKPEIITDEDREKLKQQQRDREAKARESMEREAADTAFAAEDDFDVTPDDAADDGSDDDDEDEDIEEI